MIDEQDIVEKPLEHTRVAAGFDPVVGYFQRLLPKHAAGGGGLCVYYRGEKVVDIWGGSIDQTGRPWRADTLAMVFSATKGVTAGLAHLLIATGALQLERPVAYYWPEFACNGKAAITVADILCHRSGLQNLRDMVDHAARMTDWSYMTTALAKAEPVRHQNGRPGYHAVTFGWLVGELIQRVTGLSFQDALKVYLREPFQLHDLFIGLPLEQHHRRARMMSWGPLADQAPGAAKKRLLRLGNRLLCLAPVYRRFFRALCPPGIREISFNDPALIQAPMPAFNGCFSARDLAKFYAYLAGGGRLGDKQLFSPTAMARMQAVQTRQWDRVLLGPLHWRLGFHRIIGTSHWRDQGGLAHYGIGGCGAWADPGRQLAMAMVVNSAIGTPLGDSRLFFMTSKLLTLVDRRFKRSR